MKDIILKTEDLYFSYDDEKTHSLNGLSLEIERGKKVAFMGANGSGKSTFFLSCNGIHKPSRGTVYLDGEPITYDRKGLLKARQKVGIVFQDPDNQLFSASVYQEISFGPLNLGRPEEQVAQEVEQIIDSLEITPFRTKPTHALSGGQKKQVSIADILVMNPEIIIFDEPAAALDPKHSAMVHKIVNRLSKEGITVLISTHDVNFAMEWADEIFLFHQGQVFMHGTPEEVFSNTTALAQTNLEQPACLKLFQSLVKKEILKPSLSIPRTMGMLESYIANINTTNKITGGLCLMNQEQKKAILVVSFGTSYEQARKDNIEVIEQDIANAFPEYRIYRAWTSKMILSKILKRDGLKIYNVKEAMEAMRNDGITDVIIQPTHVINGIENDLMKEDALCYRELFHSITFGTPLLTSNEDNLALIQAVKDEFKDLDKNDVLVLMGHGTTHYANAIYAALDYTFKDMGCPNIFLGTVEAYPSMETLLNLIRQYDPKKVILAPFMIVAGDHAKNDMAGDDPDSWRCQFEKAGYQVSCVLKGLGSYSSVRKIFVQHVQEAIGETQV